jgi:hypothetical protein
MVVPGCADCLAEAERHGPHDCVSQSGFRTTCQIYGERHRMDPELHRRWHEPMRCERCAMVLDDRRGHSFWVVGPCARGTCDVWSCPNCGAEWMSAGEIGCPACNKDEGCDGDG